MYLLDDMAQYSRGIYPPVSSGYNSPYHEGLFPLSRAYPLSNGLVTPLTMVPAYPLNFFKCCMFFVYSQLLLFCLYTASVSYISKLFEVHVNKC